MFRRSEQDKRPQVQIFVDGVAVAARQGDTVSAALLVSNRDVAALLPVMEFYELGLDYPDRYPDLIGQVTLEQVHNAAKTYLHPDQLLQVVVADLAEAGLGKQ